MSNWTTKFRAKLSQLRGRETDFEEEATPEIEAPDVIGTTGLVGDLLIKILLFPLHILFLPMRLLELFHQSGVEVGEDYEDESFLISVARIGKAIVLGVLSIPYLVLTAPIHFFRGLGQSGLREVLFVVPALIMCGLLGYVFTQVLTRSEVVKNRYSKGASTAIANEDYELAKVYFSRLMLETELSQPQRLQWMIVLQATGEKEKAMQVLDALAPEENLGYDKAHRLKAIQLANQISLGKSEGDTLERLGRHLERSNDNSVEIMQAKAIYFKGIGDVEKTIDSLTRAAELNPSIYLALANYQSKVGRTLDYRETLKRASLAFRDVLADNPLNHIASIQLANILTRQERIADAEKVLKEAYAKKRNVELRQALSSFYVLLFDRATSNDESIGTKLNYLISALNYDPNHPPAYQRMIELYINNDESSSSDLQVIRMELQQLISGNQPSPMAHFSLSNILWEEGKQKEAEFHLMQAYELNSEFVVVLNNLAWVLAHRKDAPDLKRAFELANKAVEIRPKDARYRDTRGTILMKLGRYREAITDLQLAIPGVNQPKLVHKKISECYSALEMDEMAENHLKRSQ